MKRARRRFLEIAGVIRASPAAALDERVRSVALVAR